MKKRPLFDKDGDMVYHDEELGLNGNKRPDHPSVLAARLEAVEKVLLSLHQTVLPLSPAPDFRPSTPEPEKSYAPWAVDHKGADFFDLSRVGFENLKGEIYADDPAEWVIGLRDWLNDKYPIQDTLAEQEAGECDPCNIHPHNGLCINCGSAGRGR
jgi:hypothetical protein